MTPSRLTIIADTREQKPFSFDADRFDTVRGKLDTGDYTLAGFETRIAIERKSLGDLVGTVINDWLRFRKELYRLAAFDLAVIVVEADLTDVLAHRYESGAAPLSILGRCHSCLIDHGVPVVFAGPRPSCEIYVEGLLSQYARKHEA